MTFESTDEDAWIAHGLAGHTHKEEIIVWDEALGNEWPAELRCHNCSAVRYLQNAEARRMIQERQLAFQHTFGTRPNLGDGTQLKTRAGKAYGRPLG